MQKYLRSSFFHFFIRNGIRTYHPDMFHLMYQRKKHTIILNTEMIKMLDDVYLGIFTNELHF